MLCWASDLPSRVLFLLPPHLPKILLWVEEDENEYSFSIYKRHFTGITSFNPLVTQGCGDRCPQAFFFLGATLCGHFTWIIPLKLATTFQGSAPIGQMRKLRPRVF